MYKVRNQEGADIIYFYNITSEGFDAEVVGEQFPNKGAILHFTLLED